MIPLTKKQLKSHEDTKVCYIYRRYFIRKLFRNTNYQKVIDHCHHTGKYRGAAHSICNLKFNGLNKIPVVFHNGSKYNYYFITKELTNEFEGQFECISEYSEKFKTFSVAVKKQIVKIDKEGNETVESIS